MFRKSLDIDSTIMLKPTNSSPGSYATDDTGNETAFTTTVSPHAILHLLLLGSGAHILVKRAIGDFEARERLEADAQDGQNYEQDDKGHENA